MVGTLRMPETKMFLLIIILLYTLKKDSTSCSTTCYGEMSSDLQAAVGYFPNLKDVLIGSEKQDNRFNFLNFLYFQWPQLFPVRNPKLTQEP